MTRRLGRKDLTGTGTRNFFRIILRFCVLNGVSKKNALELISKKVSEKF